MIINALPQGPCLGNPSHIQYYGRKIDHRLCLKQPKANKRVPKNCQVLAFFTIFGYTEFFLAVVAPLQLLPTTPRLIMQRSDGMWYQLPHCVRGRTWIDSPLHWAKQVLL